MRIRCLRGFFYMDEVAAGQVGRFMSYFGAEVVPWRGGFTFKPLADVPEYTVKGGAFLGAVATATFAGRPEELFEANEMVYDFSKGLVVPLTSVTVKTNISKSGNIFVSNGLLIPGSLTDDGTRVKDFTAWFSIDSATFRYSEVTRG